MSLINIENVKFENMLKFYLKDDSKYSDIKKDFLRFKVQETNDPYCEIYNNMLKIGIMALNFMMHECANRATNEYVEIKKVPFFSTTQRTFVDYNLEYSLMKKRRVLPNQRIISARFYEFWDSEQGGLALDVDAHLRLKNGDFKLFKSEFNDLIKYVNKWLYYEYEQDVSEDRIEVRSFSLDYSRRNSTFFNDLCELVNLK
ncbi:MAG: hypothetical protein ACP5N2_03300 [Candidatus Nanoarchaeia archaeon]